VTLRERFSRPDAFVVAAELVTSRGLIGGTHGRNLLETARELAAEPSIDVLSITDDPGGHAMLAPDTLNARARTASSSASSPIRSCRSSRWTTCTSSPARPPVPFIRAGFRASS
jgi:hypothetical protein